MGQVRLYVKAIDATEKVVPLPEYWDEMDDVEKKDWAQEELADFVLKYVKSGSEITE